MTALSEQLTFFDKWHDSGLSLRLDEWSIIHQHRVMNRALEDFPREAHDTHVVAFCHDLVEDKFVTYSDLSALGVTEEQLAAVRLLTRRKGDQTYETYIDELVTSGNVLAMQVKVYDLLDHLSPIYLTSLQKGRRMRYINALERVVKYLKHNC